MAFTYAPGRSGKYASEILQGSSRSQPSTGLKHRRAQHLPRNAWPSGSKNLHPRSPTGEALKYIAKYWDGLILFLKDGRIEMDSNAPSHRYFVSTAGQRYARTIRPIALQRKNALFAGHNAGAQNWAMLASLIEASKLNGVEPHSYLTSVFTAIVNGHKQKDIDELLPLNLKP